MNVAWTIAAAWFGAGLILAPVVYGVELAYWQRKYARVAALDYEADVGQALGSATIALLLPPFGLVLLAFTKFGLVYGVMWRRPTSQP